MTIAIREFCQPVLDTYNLSTYHATLKDFHGSLVIQTACGKLLFEINAVKFGKRKPTRTEAKYAAVLLEEFLIAHADTLHTFFNADAAFRAVNPVATVDTPYSIKTDIIDGVKNVGVREYIDGVGSLLNYQPANLFQLSTTLVKATQLSKGISTLARRTKLQQLAKQQLKYQTLRNTRENAIAKLASCKI